MPTPLDFTQKKTKTTPWASYFKNCVGNEQKAKVNLKKKNQLCKKGLHSVSGMENLLS